MAYTTINKHTAHFNTKLYTGTGSNQAITGVGFQPDLVWWKCRNVAKNHGLADVVRGNTKRIQSNSNGAETTATDYVQSFDSDGFTAGSNGNMNSSGDTFCSWNWKANGAGSSNTDGSTTSTVSVNQTAGFSIVKYAGSSSVATIGHGLGVVPKMILIKNLTSGYEWCVYHNKLNSGTNPEVKYLHLDTTNGQLDDTVFNDTAPTSSVFTCGGNKIYTNYAGQDYIAYCFAEKKGYSKFGSYTGNGSTDGTFVYTGFKPAFVLIKKSSGTEDWAMFDSTRDTHNVQYKLLYGNGNNAEYTGVSARNDFLSNGFKIRTTDNKENGSGATYIYMAFGQSLVGSNNVPCTAR